MSFVIIPKKDPKKLQNLWAPSLTTVHISLVGWDQGANVTHAEHHLHITELPLSSVPKWGCPPRTGRTSFPGVGGGQPGLGAHQRSSGKSSGGNLGVGSQLEGACFRPQLGRTWCCACLLELAFNQNPEPA